jgi:REP element-mobilizing transposase RayT
MTWGGIAVKCWKEIPLYFPGIELDEFVVMPNHVHGIIAIVGMMGPASVMLLGGAIQESPRPEENEP